MIALSALLPCATIVLAILILRQTAVRAALAGASVAVLLWALGHFSSPNFTQIGFTPKLRPKEGVIPEPFKKGLAGIWV